MFTWEHTNHSHTSRTLKDAFTTEERVQLQALRERYDDTHDCDEFGLDVEQLRFVRWLVAHGRISEGVEEYTPA